MTQPTNPPARAVAEVEGSDAHEPDAVARRFSESADMVEGCGFRPGRTVFDYWRR